uniref:Uncharacterized protein n=1 Tax=Oreochromis aureus TaxID=47969 RepID=A0AAZ1XAI6_OREAU
MNISGRSSFKRLTHLKWKKYEYIIFLYPLVQIQLIIELLWPLFLFVILISVRHSHPPYKQSQCHFPNKALPSGIICNINNPCFHSQTPGETPGQVVLILAWTLICGALWGFGCNLNLFISTADLPVKQYLRPNETFSAFLLTNASMSPVTVEELLNARLNFQTTLAVVEMQLKDMVCNRSILEQLLTVDGGEAAMTDLQTQMCDLPADVLQETERLFLSQLDLTKFLTRDRLMANAGELRAISQAVTSVSQELTALLDDIASLSSFADMSAALRVLSPENRTAMPRESFRAFSKIVCGHHELDGERIPSLNWYEDNDIKSFLGKNGTEDVNVEHNNNTTPFCKNLVQALESIPLSRIVWRGIKPLFIGKLLYTPNTPAVQQVMKEVNQTLEDLQIIQELNEAWLEVGPQIKSYMETSVEVKMLQDLLRQPEIAVLVNLRLEDTPWTASRIARFLSTPSPDIPQRPGAPLTWLDIYNDINQTISTLAQVTECFSLNKLEGLETEGQLIERALELLEDRQFWADVVFLLPNTSSSELPPHVTYKIRMDIDDVTRTNKLKDRPVSRVLTGDRQTTGIYIQQMPYPCYVDDSNFSCRAAVGEERELHWIWPWYFIFQLNYWGGVPLEADHIEPEPSNMILGVSIRNLVKIYKKGGELAVNHFFLSLFECTCVEGVGLVELLNILSLIFRATKATTFNFLLLDSRVDCFDRISIKERFSPTFRLTVEEHVWFYGCMKGLSEAEVKAELDTLLEDVGLLHKRHKQTKNLLGKVTSLTSFRAHYGVVLTGVRRLWGRSILSTHYMDEAELLGDWIAIISQGKLCCCRSPLFLKSQLGSGYYLTVVKREGLDTSTPSNFRISTSASSNKLPPLIKVFHLYSS